MALKNPFNSSCEDFHNGFRAILKGKDHSICKARVNASVFPVFTKRSQMCKFFFTFIELSLLSPVRPNRLECSDPNLHVHNLGYELIEKKLDRDFTDIFPPYPHCPRQKIRETVCLYYKEHYSTRLTKTLPAKFAQSKKSRFI